jgi:hypothetical protein
VTLLRCPSGGMEIVTILFKENFMNKVYFCGIFLFIISSSLFCNDLEDYVYEGKFKVLTFYALTAGGRMEGEERDSRYFEPQFYSMFNEEHNISAKIWNKPGEKLLKFYEGESIVNRYELILLFKENGSKVFLFKDNFNGYSYREYITKEYEGLFEWYMMDYLQDDRYEQLMINCSSDGTGVTDGNNFSDETFRYYAGEMAIHIIIDLNNKLD